MVWLYPADDISLADTPPPRVLRATPRNAPVLFVNICRRRGGMLAGALLPSPDGRARRQQLSLRKNLVEATMPPRYAHRLQLNADAAAPNHFAPPTLRRSRAMVLRGHRSRGRSTISQLHAGGNLIWAHWTRTRGHSLHSKLPPPLWLKNRLNLTPIHCGPYAARAMGLEGGKSTCGQ